MSYRNPSVLQDTNAFNAKAKALQNITKGSDETFKPAEEEKLSDVSKDLDPAPQSTAPSTTAPQSMTPSMTEVPGINTADSSFSVGVGATNTDTSFYKNGGPINDTGFYVNPTTEPTTDPNDLDITKNIK